MHAQLMYNHCVYSHAYICHVYMHEMNDVLVPRVYSLVVCIITIILVIIIIVLYTLAVHVEKSLIFTKLSLDSQKYSEFYMYMT